MTNYSPLPTNNSTDTPADSSTDDAKEDTTNKPAGDSKGVLDDGKALSESPKISESKEDEAFRKWIEMEVLKIMKQQIQNKDVSQTRIQDMANRTLELITPGMNIQDLFKNAIRLNEGYPEFDGLTIKLIKEYEHKFKKKAVQEASELVKQGNLDQAEDVVKKILEYKMM